MQSTNGINAGRTMTFQDVYNNECVNMELAIYSCEKFTWFCCESFNVCILWNSIKRSKSSWFLSLSIRIIFILLYLAAKFLVSELIGKLISSIGILSWSSRMKTWSFIKSNLVKFNFDSINSQKVINRYVNEVWKSGIINNVRIWTSQIVENFYSILNINALISS